MSGSLNIEFWGGQSLELQTPNKETFFTQLVNHEHVLIVQKPMSSKNVPMIIENGTSVAVYFQDEIEGLCVFISKIYQLQNGRVIIDKPSNESIKKVQRRRFFRVEVSTNLQLFLPTTEDHNQLEELNTITHDISGGGLSFLSPKKIVKLKDDVEGVLHLKIGNKQQKVRFNAKVVHIVEQESKFYKNSLQFIGMSESTRSEIIHYCMSKQIEFHKKTKGFSTD